MGRRAPLSEGLLPLSDERPWQRLLPHASTLLDAVPESLRSGMTIGGGTSLFLALGHRISMDLDLFHHDAQVLQWVSPRIVDHIADLFPDALEGGSFTKFPVGNQEIDIIIAAPVARIPPLQCLAVGPHVVAVEHPVEVLAKKILYRGAEARARDLFDLAAVRCREPTWLESAARACGPKAIRRLRTRIERARPRLAEALAVAVKPCADWLAFRPSEVLHTLEEALRSMETAAQEPS